VSQQGLLISVRSGVNARPSRRLISRPSDVDPDRDRAKSATLHALNLISLRMTGKAGSDVLSEGRQYATPVQPAFLPVAAQLASKRPRGLRPLQRDDTRKE